jgi:2-polyprenyl-3-methyl-5-hydroxy-6-metoxy-1,4-benzoquinol methylase
LHNNMDKAGKGYWDNIWEGQTIPSPVDPRSSGLRGHYNRSFHKLFSRVLSTYSARHPGGISASSAGSRQALRPPSLLEIGAARSTWLPYFNREFGFQVVGIDYSEVGCRQASAILDAAGVDGTIVCANFFTPPAELLGTFDVIVSFGVVEHFQDTTAVLTNFARFLKPGGLIITSIPNFTGLMGWMQKRLSRTVYDIHVPMDKDTLALAHRRAGLQMRACGYFMGANLGVLNFHDWPVGPVRTVAMKLQAAVSLLIWALEMKGSRIRPNKFTSPYVVCVAVKPESRMPKE